MSNNKGVVFSIRSTTDANSETEMLHTHIPTMLKDNLFFKVVSFRGTFFRIRRIPNPFGREWRVVSKDQSSELYNDLLDLNDSDFNAKYKP